MWPLSQSIDFSAYLLTVDLNPDSNLRLFILPVTQAKEAKMPTIPTTKITTSLTSRSMSQIWPFSHKNVPKKEHNWAKFEAHPFDRVWVNGSSNHPHLSAVLPEIRWENVEKVKIFYPTVGKTCPFDPPATVQEKIVLTLGCWFLSIGLAVPRSKTPSGRKISFAFGQNQLKSQLLNWTSWFGVQKLIEIGAVSLNFMIGSYLSVQVFSMKKQIQDFCLQNYSALRLRGRDFTNVKVARSSNELSWEMTKHHQQCSWQLLNHCDISYRPKGKLKRVDGWYDLRREMVAVCLAGGLYLRMVACDMVGPSSTGPEYWVGQFWNFHPGMLRAAPNGEICKQICFSHSMVCLSRLPNLSSITSVLSPLYPDLGVKVADNR